ncbi:hypothetical protein WICPIJ_001870 [Wickerhamomyces pijperi]|uniref:Uncharacterized protein n=1 Tax=Wickerhamomyces pijperi TaxID=599730 RepID=A0A9P8TQB9_WICPI|nr:hypothetical protein WICPIJ_001870 [Wickerhamomyces pijperi]
MVFVIKSVESRWVSDGKVKIKPLSTVVINTPPALSELICFLTVSLTSSGSSSKMEIGGWSNPHEIKSMRNCNVDNTGSYFLEFAKEWRHVWNTGESKSDKMKSGTKKTMISSNILAKSSTKSGMSSTLPTVAYICKYVVICSYANFQIDALVSAGT